MLPVPTLSQLSTFTGRSTDTFGPFASSALAQATLLFTLRTRRTELPTDPDQAMLATYAILQMADRIYLEQPNAQTLASPYQSETIGSYSYSKGSTAAKAQDGISTGLYWWDLAMDLLTDPGSSSVMFGAVEVFGTEIIDDGQGNRFVPGPADSVYIQDRSTSF
jgi:hypothetical protein